jgi:phosphoglycolate phosphatase-like HAD superfamily hydrolase
MTRFRAVFFDFDGVLVDSAGVKTKAMGRLFEAERPEHVAAIVQLHERLGGVSRYRKFELAYETILRRPLPDDECRRLGRRFSDLALDGVFTSPMIPGAMEILDLYHRQIPLFVISGTPEDELRMILSRRDLTRFFRSVHGSPALKPEILRSLLSQHGWSPREACFIGDAKTDWEAARDCSVCFVGVVAHGHANPFGRDTVIVPDLRSLDLALERAYVSGPYQ